ncbi:TIGR03546 family protein [Pleionea litopenaei]|uniref:TIGR03546 family protein n=1 Tax=Pleionea litopenaei TaxID=3070815 RepID=A0AA51X6A3_9GAMM|nr:TIGR03546 family protein [Pleionea sp. HL-JVS1]WMS86918.1 TIGR03546 family protein [Pleionea sp. HL-JVS1]
MLTVIAKLLKILNSEDSPSAVGWAIALAFVFAMLPLFSVAKWAVVVLVAMLRVNLSAFILFSALFALLAWLFDPWLNQFGLWLLTLPSLKEFWQALYGSPIGEALALNNTLALSTLLLSIVALVPVYWGGVGMIRLYRSKLKARFDQWRIVSILKSTKVYKIYQSLSA